VTASPSEPAYWEALYREGGDGWEQGRAAPPLVRHFAADAPRGRRALVVGCGRGHEARLLAQSGAHVVAIDFAPAAIAAARELGDAGIEFRQHDLFALAGAPERYDLVVEHCCFCAIEPARRGAYVDAVANALEPGGELVGLFYAHGRPGGPPFGTTRDELRTLFADRFAWRGDEVPGDSVERRAGQELLVRMTRR
jgi:SAM-dependent methyltransferase